MAIGDSADPGPAVEPVAIVGMACRVPGAANVRQFWKNLTAGVESVRRFTRAEQLAVGVPVEELDDPAFVPAAPVLDDMAGFDAAFFGMTPREAELADPQQRLFLELCHTALEDAGHPPGRVRGEVGVYGGTGVDDYLWRNIRGNRRIWESAGRGLTMVGNSPDYLATFTSYKLDLRGPSMTVQTACSTSLVAVHLACEALRSGECDLAVAGGTNIELPHHRGYLPRVGGVDSSDGHCAPFSEQASGTVWGSGGGTVVLKRLSEAVEDGDHVRAVILGNAVNNDGSEKVSFTAPGPKGQTAVIAQALSVAGVTPAQIGYVEAHGTGTRLGDPIEIAALTEAFGREPRAGQRCAIGSAKSNIGHLSQGAGVVGLIKVALMVSNGLLPPSLNVTAPHPGIDFTNSPFTVNTVARVWEAAGPRRAGVSSFGFGGTNAHLVVEQPPAPPAAETAEVALIPLSAKTESALRTAATRLAEHVAESPELTLADIAHTLRAGRDEYPHRSAVVARTREDVARLLARPSTVVADPATKVAFLFSGQGSQYPGMGAELHRAEPVFRSAMDECLELARAELGADLRHLLAEHPDETQFAQPALFAVGYALSRLWRSWGVEPEAMIGHSVGEYAAAAEAGVFTAGEAVRLVCARGRLMQQAPPGAMLAVSLDEARLRERLPAELALAAVNGSGACVVAGVSKAVEGFAAELSAEHIQNRGLRTSHAFHSPLMDEVLPEFRAEVAAVSLRRPDRPYLSTRTGEWITPEQATDPEHWVRQLRDTVRFGDCVQRLLATGSWALVECGPGRQLAGLARIRPKGAARSKGPLAVASLPSPGDSRGDVETLYAAAGRLWTVGVPVRTGRIGTPGRRVPLPTYPFERTHYFVEPDPAGAPQAEPGPVEHSWVSVPTWRQTGPLAAIGEPSRWLVFGDGARGTDLVTELRRSGADVVEVVAGEAFRSGSSYCVRATEQDDYARLFADLAARGGMPTRIAHAWLLDAEEDDPLRAQNRGLFSLIACVRALAATAPAQSGENGAIGLDVLTRGARDVTGADLVSPASATVAAFAAVAPTELPVLRVRHLDLGPEDRPSTGALLAELRAAAGDPIVALRGGRRWIPEQQPVPELPEADSATFRRHGVYLITGGTGGIGITVAEHLARRVAARLVLTSRHGVPPEREWDALGESGRSGRAVAAVRRMRAAGAEVEVVAADVSDAADLARVREVLIGRFGRLDGIVHAAGVAGGQMIEAWDRGEAERVLGPKLLGTSLLRSAFGDLSPDFLVLCSSTSALAGAPGQVDYSAANAYLDACASAVDGWPARRLSVNWGRWLEVGMAVETEVPREWQRVLDQPGERWDHPILTRRDGDGRYRGTVSPATHWVLAEHRHQGRALLPGAAHVELIRAAFEDHVPRSSSRHRVELSDLVFVRPLVLADEQSAGIRVAVRADAGDYRVEVASETGVHAEARARWISDEAPEPVDLRGVRARHGGPRQDYDGERLAQAGGFALGERWRSLRHTTDAADGTSRLAWFELPSTVQAEAEGLPLHPAVLDEVTSVASDGQGRYLPLSYGRLVVHRPFPARLWTWARYHGARDGEAITADLSVVDEHGDLVLTVADFVMRRTDVAAAAALSSRAAGQAGEPAEGLRPEQAVDLLDRLLGADLGPRAIVSAVPLARIRQRAEAITASGSGAAPADDLETAIARVWADVLGVAEVGVDEDFAELGGNSLTAVQLISQVRSAVGVRVPMQVLFEAPTVAAMAGVVARMRGDASGSS
ncbi:type I polyketide synthase [Amycolatopsis benzoatilytica]|uniref:type I polyketide synthase n=1 Tax=Amycolatopsis benzoatilytica TaxID=346045 RepID=UPI0003629EFC|nr:type I polyketide synthase [Amycolatopsis benzoatilytica]